MANRLGARPWLRLLRASVRIARFHLARWQSGYAAACKAVYPGSIPSRASRYTKATPNGWFFFAPSLAARLRDKAALCPHAGRLGARTSRPHKNAGKMPAIPVGHTPSVTAAPCHRPRRRCAAPATAAKAALWLFRLRPSLREAKFRLPLGGSCRRSRLREGGTAQRGWRERGGFPPAARPP